jgi:hypothetical protein
MVALLWAASSPGRCCPQSGQCGSGWVRAAPGCGQGLAQGQPHVSGQQVLAVLPWGLAGLLQAGQQLLCGLGVPRTQGGHQEVTVPLFYIFIFVALLILDDALSGNR